MKKGQAVLVTTEFRGVFFGYLAEFGNLPAEVTLTKARNVVYWPSGIHGFLGLATDGPGKGCRIGPAVERLTLWKITSVSPVCANAVGKFEAEPWD